MEKNTLNFPELSLQTRRSADDKVQVYDRLRAKWVALTPEEMVRQCFVRWLIEHKGYPSGLMANEVSVSTFGRRRRCDTLIYTRAMEPLMIVEYKAPSVDVTRAVFDQVLRYYGDVRAPYLVVSNGLNHYCCRVDKASLQATFLSDIPPYSEIE